MTKTITLTEFRSEPGEVIRAVYRHGNEFILTKSGNQVARLIPISPDETVVILSDGTIIGKQPLTYRRSDLLLR